MDRSMPATRVRPAGAEWPRAARVPGSTVAMFIDGSVPGADLNGGVNVLAPDAVIPVHWHPVGELQFILSGTGVSIDPGGTETPVGPHSVVFSPAGASGGHGFRNTGLVPLSILFVYAAPGGAAPDFHLIDGGEEPARDA